MTTPVTEAVLEPRPVGDIVGEFFIPAYQRGYRWGVDEVRRLLDDIWASRDSPYYLQPIVVKRLPDDRFELIDGQQRLTTLYLIFRYMTNEKLKNVEAPYSISYETRKQSAEFLTEPNEADSGKNIDFFHIFRAYQQIHEWFGDRQNDRQLWADDIYGALRRYVHVIWYEAATGVDETTLFTRLNIGRIPLTDAELVKALVLARSNGRDGVTDRALEIAAQWDKTEQELRDPELWAFATGRSTTDPTHISLLLDTLADSTAPPEPDRARPLFHTFETLRPEIEAHPQRFWNRVLDLHALLMGWYGNRDLFHKIGYLVAEGASLLELITRSEGKRKSEFEAEIDDLIRHRLNLTEDELRDLEYGSNRAERALLLMNVETVRLRTASSERYSFREHARGRWSLEHIHAQNSQRLNRAEQWESWLKRHREVLADIGDIDDDARRQAVAEIDQVLLLSPITAADFRPAAEHVTRLLSPALDSSVTEMDSIANLALLALEDNIALSNAVFAVKRAEVIGMDRAGSYIPACTRNVFLKYYSPESTQQLHFWSATDRGNYLDEMVSKLRPYLQRGEPDAEAETEAEAVGAVGVAS